MPVKLLGDVKVGSPLAKSVFVCFFFFYPYLNKGRQTEVEEYCMLSRKRLKRMTVSCILALLMVQLLSNTIKVGTTTLLGPHHREEKLYNTLFQG